MHACVLAWQSYALSANCYWRGFSVIWSCCCDTHSKETTRGMPREDFSLKVQTAAGVNDQQTDDLVLRVLLSANLSSPYELLRPFHTTCSAGRGTALRTITHVHLERCKGQGVPYSRQLAVLGAADQAKALTMDACQIGGLLGALGQQQQQQEEEEEERVEGEASPHTPEARLDGVLKSAFAADAAPSSSNPTITTTSSSSSSSSRGVANAPPPSAQGPTAVKPRGPQLTHITVDGELSRSNMEQLEHLLDVLPGTQHLQQIVLSQVLHPDAEVYWRKGVVETPLGMSWPQGGMAAADGAGDCSTHTYTATCVNLAVASSSSTTTTTSSSSQHTVQPGGNIVGSLGGTSSWRSSCDTVLAGRFHHSAPVPISNLAPLLGSLQQLKVLHLHEVEVEELHQLAPRLGQLRALHIDLAQLRPNPTLTTVAALSELRRLDLVQCIVGRGLHHDSLPTAFTALACLTSLDLSGTLVYQHSMQMVCSMTNLRVLNLSGSIGLSDRTSLPRSITHLTQLESLLLHEGRASTLPDTLPALTWLRRLELTVRWHRLELDMVWRLTSLEHLVISDHNMPSLPGGVSALTGLTELWCEARSFQRLTSSLAALQGLQRLTLYAAGQWEALPDGVAAASQLTYLMCNAPSGMLQGLPATVHVHDMLKSLRW